MEEKDPGLPRYDSYHDPNQPEEPPAPEPERLYPTAIRGAIAAGLLGVFIGSLPEAVALMSQNAPMEMVVLGALQSALIWGGGFAVAGAIVGGLVDERRRRQKNKQ